MKGQLEETCTRQQQQQLKQQQQRLQSGPREERGGHTTDAPTYLTPPSTRLSRANKRTVGELEEIKAS